MAVAGFWFLVVVAQSRQPGYAPSRDFVSALASEGARWPLLGIGALLVFGVAYLAAGVVLDDDPGTRLGAALLAGAGLLTWVVALARIDCPFGAAGCSLPSESGVLAADTGARLGPELHGWAVAGSYTLVALAMLVTAVLWWRRDRRLGLLSAAALVTSLATVPFWIAGDPPGGPQRVWLGILSAWVVLVCVQPLRGGAEEERR